MRQSVAGGNIQQMRATRGTLRLALVAHALAFLPACGGSLVATAEPLPADDQTTTSRVARDPARPMLVEWPAADRALLESESTEHIVVVEYGEGRMRLLPGCRVAGEYELHSTTPARDHIEVATVDELYASLPLGAASLRGRLRRGHALRLDYVVVGHRRASVETVHGGELEGGDCDGATHWVRGMVVGAYELSLGRTLAVGAKAKALSAKAGGGHREDREVLRTNGDIVGCHAEEADGTERSCGALVQLDLAPILEAREETAPGPRAEAPDAGPAPDAATEPVAVTEPVVSAPEGMVAIPAGTFTMGTDGGEPDEAPAHSVTLDAFFVDRSEVTIGEYSRCVREGVCTEPATSGNCADQSGELHPITCVDFAQAATYCRWAGKRLPTEAEWEYAARGTDARTYPWGNEPPTCARADFAPSGATANSCGGKGTSSIGAHPAGASPFGVEDMAGNVWEWVADYYGPTYYREARERNPEGPSRGDKRVVRGGVWGSPDREIRAMERRPVAPNARLPGVGFRCAQ